MHAYDIRRYDIQNCRAIKFNIHNLFYIRKWTDVGRWTKSTSFYVTFVIYITRCNVPYIAICHVVIRYVTLPTLPTLHTLRYIMLRPPRYLTILHVVLRHHTLRDGVVMCLAFSCNPNEEGHTKPVVWVVR